MDSIISRGQRYPVVLVDPPWPFKTFTKQKAVPARGEQPYECMSLGEIAGLPVPAILERNSAVFLWSCDSIPGDLDFLAKAWDMRVATRNVFIWVKPSIGMGYYTRKRAEVCHLLVKGRLARKSKGVDQVIDARRREHSRKPDEQYSRIEALFDGPYLELFARTERPGWTVWGNEVGLFQREAA